MSLSFEDSLKINKENNVTTNNEMFATMSIDDKNIETASVMAYSMENAVALVDTLVDTDNWHPITDKGYKFYENEYADTNYSSVDELKNIILDSSQFNITQEKNSQYIPFQMPRYYDGFDLTKTRLGIYYINKNNDSHTDIPVDVYYSDDGYIRFAWLVSEFATQVAGILQFEIHAEGVNNKGEPYIWKSKSIDKLNVLQSLEDVATGDIGLSEEEAEGWYNLISESANKAINASTSAQNYADEAKRIYQEMEDGIADEVETLVNDSVGAIIDETISDQLRDYATKQDVEDAIAAEDITTKLGNYYTKDETYSKSEVDTALDNVSVDLTGYATETWVDGKIAPLSSSVGTNTGNISSLSTALGKLQGEINSLDKSPRKTYDIVYNDITDENSGENVLVLYEIENENKEDEVKSVKRKYTIAGGGGGGGSASANTLVLYYDKDKNNKDITLYVFTAENFKNKEAVIYYDFSGSDASGSSVPYANGEWQIRKGTSGAWTSIKKDIIYPNTDIPFNVSDYISSAGTYSLRLVVTDDAGGYAQKIWSIQYINFSIEPNFDDKFTYPAGKAVSFSYIPQGAISKDIHFILDGKNIGKVTTSSSGIPMPFEIPAQEHGAHLLEVYMTAKINENTIESNHIFRDILWFDDTSDIPVIGTTYQNFTARQYDATNIEYTVYDPTTETPTIEIAVDGVIVSTPTLNKSTNVYPFKTDVVGEHIITITCGETVKTLKANVTKLDIDITPVTAGLMFDFNPSGKSNNDVDKIWSNGDVSMSVSDNFDWVNGGYQFDENGDQYFCIKAGTSAEIDYQLFADDAKKNGKEFKLVFKTTNVAKPDATFLHCMDNTTGSDHIGIQMNVHEAFIYGQAGKLDLSYSEEDVIEFEFNISKNTESIPMVMGYEDGVSTRPMVYDDSHNFTQNTPKVISLGSEECDLHIYRFKVYNTSLTDRGILNNFIADARNAEEMISRYNRNQIYDENQNLDPDVLAEKCPWLRVYKISAPYFTNNKSDKVPYTTIQQIYKDGDPVLDNWTCYDCSHSGQGTSSNNYGAAGRNLDFIMNKSQRDGVKPYFVLGDGTETDKITLTRTSVPVAYLNAKVNIASSNNMTNAMLANRYNEFNPYNRPFIRTASLSDTYSDEEISKMTEEEQSAALVKLQEKVDIETSYIKDTMEFHNCVIFIQETNEDVSTHREFADTNYHFYAIGNIGDSKKSDASRLTDMDDKYECCVEIMDVEFPLSDFPIDTMYNAMGYKEDEVTHEKTYIWAKNENLGILYEKIGNEYVLTEDTEVDLNKTYYVDILEHDDFSEDFTYGWRYLYEGDDDEENAEVFNYCKQKWIELYRFITTSTDEEFKNRFDEYFVKDTALYYYLFTTRYCMADNRAKNCFIHYSKTGEVDGEGNPIRKWDLSWGYDMDTSLGLNNYGKQVYRYGLEDTDVDENGEEVFRESDSTFFCRIRDLFPTELKTMYNTLESKNAWHAESFINKADEWQSQFPEELWRVDIERKYIRTYNSSFIDGEGDAQFLTNMANGKMKYHRRQWERSQEKYMASKYQSSVASGDNSVFRCSVPNGDLAVQPNYRLKLTPYAYMYLNVKYGTQNPIQLRAEPNKVYEIPFSGDKADIVDVYSSSLIQDFGDLSTCYVATADTSKASKVKRLIFGNDTEGYDNPNFTTLTTGANYLLEELNIENVSGLTQSLNLTALNNLKKLYAHGSNIGGVTFADGGKIEIAELPAISALSMKNLIYLTNLDIADFSKLTTLTVENCNTVDLLDILDRANNINRVRITDVNWTLDNVSLLERLYAMKGIDKNGYNADQSVLTGKVYVPTIKQRQLYDYQNAWSDLKIECSTLIEQYPVTFVNTDGSILETQWVDKGEDAVNPTTRVENPLSPTIPSTVSHDFVFAGWEGNLTDVFEARTIIATYTETLRTYTIKYVSKGITMQESTGLYGENVPYTGETPTYTAEESGYVYYLFNRWDKSGFLDGDFDENDTKIVNAMFDEFIYTAGVFEDRELSSFSPVEIYALTKLNEIGVVNIQNIITDKDPYTIVVGNDVDYGDIESELLISEKTYFDGTNYIDTGIQLFDEDKDFVLAIDYEFLGNNNANAVLAQCFQENGFNGFKLSYNNGVKFAWGNTSDNVVVPPNFIGREVIVIRHKKGDNNLTIYKSNLDGDEVLTRSLTRSRSTSGKGTLVFGSAKDDTGVYKDNAIGNIYWAKVWYKDLGNEVCKDLAMWTHESVTLEACGFGRYYLSNDQSKKCSFSLLASHLLGRTRVWNNSIVNDGGWAESNLNKLLDARLYSAMPTQIKSLLKQVVVYSNDGINNGNPEALYPNYRDITSSDCYIAVPALIEIISSTMSNSEPYNSEGTTISYLTTDVSRKRAFDGGDYSPYWTRTPNASQYSNYVWFVGADGKTYNNNPDTRLGILIMISF